MQTRDAGRLTAASRRAGRDDDDGGGAFDGLAGLVDPAVGASNAGFDASGAVLVAAFVAVVFAVVFAGPGAGVDAGAGGWLLERRDAIWTPLANLVA